MFEQSTYKQQEPLLTEKPRLYDVEMGEEISTQMLRKK